MQVFKAAARIVFRNPTVLVIYAGFLSLMGVFITGSFQFAPEESAGFVPAQASIAVVDRDGSDLSRAVRAWAEGQGTPVQVEDDGFAQQDAVASGFADYLLVIPAGYGNDYVAAARSGGEAPLLHATYGFESVSGTLVDEQVNQYLGLVWAAAALDPDAPAASLVAGANDTIAQEASVETMATTGSSQKSDQFAFYLKWSTYTMMAAIVICAGTLMSAFNRTDLRRRNLTSPLPSLSLGLQVALGCLLVAVLVWAWTMGLGLAVFGNSLAGLPFASVALLAGAALAFALVPLALGFLLGQLGLGELAVNAIGNIAGLVLSFLGGAWVSLDLMAPEVLLAARFSPTYWFNEAAGRIVRLTDPTWANVAPILGQLGVVALFAVALFAVALATGRLRLQSTEAGGNAAAHASAS